MLRLSFVLLIMAAALGAWLGARTIVAVAPRAKRRWIKPTHGTLGGAGLLALLGALHEAAPTARAVRLGVGGFGSAAGWLLGAAWLLGALILLSGMVRGGSPGWLIAVHAGLAATGVTLLLAFLGLPG